jgi:hypothetical protein
LAICDSHPSSADMLQSANPALHIPITHVPVEHDAPALAKLHACPHAPQFVGFMRTSASHPFAMLWSQSPNPAAHMMPHVPPAHVASEFGSIGHAL